MDLKKTSQKNHIDLADLEKQVVLDLLKNTQQKGSLKGFKDWFGKLGDNGNKRENYDTFARIFLFKLITNELKRKGYKDIQQQNDIAVKIKKNILKKIGKDNIDENLKIDEELFKRKCKSLIERIKNEIKMSYQTKKESGLYNDDGSERISEIYRT